MVNFTWFIDSCVQKGTIRGVSLFLNSSIKKKSHFKSFAVEFNVSSLEELDFPNLIWSLGKEKMEISPFSVIITK